MTRPLFHRRRHDPPGIPLVTVHHGSNADCPDVRSGQASRCHGHTSASDLVSAEGPIEHLRNALQLVRVLMDFGELIVGNNEPAVLVPVDGLDAIQRRIEAAIGLLESATTGAGDLNGAACCVACGGTVLAPTIGGVPRGTCHCPSNRFTDWSASQIQRSDNE